MSRMEAGEEGYSYGYTYAQEGFCPDFTDTLLRLIMGREGCHGTEAEVCSRVQA